MASRKLYITFVAQVVFLMNITKLDRYFEILYTLSRILAFISRIVASNELF